MQNNFKIPLRTEVEQYIKTLFPSWPAKFSEYYSDRFWNYYQAQGWKLSNNVAMKDWKCAFKRQWAKIRNINDVEEFNRLSKPPVRIADHQPNERIEEVYRKYLHHPTIQPDRDFIEIYDELEKYPDFKFTADQVKICRGYGPEKGKAVAVKMYFDRLALGKKAM